MISTFSKRVGLRLLVLAAPLLWATACAAEPGRTACPPRSLDEMRKLSGCRLAELYRNGTLCAAPAGDFDGAVLWLNERCLPRVKVFSANLAWKGKHFWEDACFINRWIGGRRWIASRYTVGPSWFDGKPAVMMEYPARTPLLANMHDEIRELSPGLYIGVLYDRFPCPKFRGFIGLQSMGCCK